MNTKNLKSIVRRLCPTETDRLMGFPEDYTKIRDNIGDSHRYKQAGNSWAANCAEWVNSRIERTLRETGMVANNRAIKYGTTCSGVECHSISVSDKNWQAKFFSEVDKAASDLLSVRYPHIPNLGDMTKLDGTKYNLDVFSGGTPCFTAGNMVLTEHGYRPIEEIEEGDYVVSHKGRLCKVLRVGYKKAHNIVDVKCRTTPSIRCTSDHPFFGVTKEHRDYRRHSDTYLKTVIDQVGFKAVKDIGVGGMVAKIKHYPESIPVPHFPKVYSASKEDIIELAGWYAGDGHIRTFEGKNKKTLVLSLSEKKLKSFEARFGDLINYNITPHTQSVYRVCIHNTALCDWLVSNFGKLSHQKTVPAWLITSAPRYTDSFIHGYMATDGYCDAKTEFGCSTTSFSLALGLAELVGYCNISQANVPPKKVMYDGRIVNQRDYFMCRKYTHHRVHHEYDMWDFVRISKINKVGSDWVYNIEVEQDHSYIVNGICVHNCQSVSVAGKRHGMAEDSGTRSSLAFHWLRIGAETDSQVLLWENVCGAFSANEGRDFAWFVHRITERGYAVAWRVLDAQHTFSFRFPRAIPQRRRRIWLVAFKNGDWRMAAQVLFERSRVTGSYKPRRILNDGTEITTTKTESADDAFDFFASFSGPSFDESSRSDILNITNLPQALNIHAYDALRACGEVRYFGDMFNKGVTENDEDPSTLNPLYLENIGAGAGVAVGRTIFTLKMPEWTGGMQLPWGEMTCPDTFNGTVCGLADVLLPWGDYLSKYLISKRACEGIQKRAEKRGKKLDPIIANALEYQIGAWNSGALDKYLTKVEEEADGLREADDINGDETDADYEGE